VIQHILDEDDSDLFEDSDESNDLAVDSIITNTKAASSQSQSVDDPHTELMKAVAANLVKGIVPGALVSEKVQEELTERIWRETRVLHVDAVAPLMYLARALAMNHSWWQVELAIKVITSKLGLRERNELAQNAMCQDQYETFIQDMQEGLVSTQTELMRFDSYAKSSAYQRICTMIANSKDSPEGLRSEQELILRSLRDAENNLQAVKRTVEDSSRLLNEAQMAETEQIQWSADMPRRKEKVEDFFKNMAKIKQNTSAKLEQDFQTAGQRMERILHETTELEKMAEQTEIKTVQQQRTLEEKQEELREVKEKLRRMKQGSDRHKNEYQAFKQDLEDERETVITRLKSAQRLLEGYLQQIEGFHQDLRQVLMEEVAWKMEQEALKKAEKAKNERKDAQDLYKDAQDRLRLTEDMLAAMTATSWSGNMVNELMRKNEEIAQLSQRAVEVEEMCQDEMTKLDELRQWLCEFGQPEVARGLKKFVKSKGEFTVPKVEKSNPIRLAMVLQRLVPRFCRRSKRKDALEREVTQDWCPGDAEHKRNKERRERCKVLMEQPDIQLPGENGFVLRTFYGHNTWRWRLFRSLSAPAKLWKDEGPAPKSLSKTPSGTTKSPRKSMAVSPEGQKVLSHRRGSKDHSTASPVSPAVSRRNSKAAPGRKALVPEDARGPRARQGGKSGQSPLAEDPGDFNFLSRWAAAPWSRWDKEEVPRALWESFWRNLWADAKKIFEAVPPDTTTDEGIPVWEGDHGIAHFWQDCHLILQRLRKVICKNLEGLSHLQQLHSTIGNAKKILGDKKRRKAKSGENSEEDREERDLAVASESARNLLDECREVLVEGAQHQQEQMWLCAMLLGQLCGLREALISTLGPLKVLGEEHEDLTLACRVLVHVSQFPQIQMEVISLGRHLHAWQRSVKLDLRQLQSRHKTLEEEWHGLVGESDSLLANLESIKGPKLSEQSFHLEEAIIEVSTIVHCILENRWMRKKVPSVDRKILLDWKTRSQQLKAGLRTPLDESAKLASKVQGKRSETTALLRNRSKKLDEGLEGETSDAPASPDKEETAREETEMSPDLEEAIAELMAQMVQTQETLVRQSGEPSPRGGSASPSRPGRLSALSQPRQTPRQTSRGASPAPNFLLEDVDVDAPKGPVLPVTPRGSSHDRSKTPRGGEPGSPRGVTFEDLARVDDAGSDHRSEGERSALGGVDDEFPDAHVVHVTSASPRRGSQPQPISPGNRSLRSAKSAHSLRSSKSQAELLDEAFEELLQKRLDDAKTPSERAYQAELMDTAYQEMRKTLTETDAFFFQDESDPQVDDLTSFPRARRRRRASSQSASSGSDDDSFLHARSDSEALTWPSRMSRTASGLSLVKSRSWAAGIPSATRGRTLVRTESRELVRVVHGKSERVTLQSPKAVGVELEGRPQRLVAAQPVGRRRLLPLLLPWKPQDPKKFHLGSFGGIKGHEARHTIAATVTAPMQSEQDRQLKREALVYQASRPSTPKAPSEEGLVLSRPLSATSRPLSATSRTVELHDSASSANLPGHLWVPGEESGRGMRHYITQEDLQNLQPPEAEAPQVSIHTLQDVHTFLEEHWTPIDKEKLKDIEEQNKAVGGQENLSEDDGANEEAYLDAPLDDMLMRPQTPAWLLDITNPQSRPVEDVPLDEEDPGETRQIMALSDFAVNESPETWVDGTPSPWEVRPPTAEELLIVPKPQLPTPCSSRASTGTPRTFVAQGQRCRSASVQDSAGVTLPAISGPVMEVDEPKHEVPRPASVDPGGSHQRWRSVAPQGLLPRSSSPDAQGENHPESQTERGVQKITIGSEVPHRPVSAGGPLLLKKYLQASAACSAELQRNRVEGPKPLSARRKAPAMPEIHGPNERRESQASDASAMALAATLAQKQLMAKMKGRPQTGNSRGNATPHAESNAKAWLDVFAQANVEPKVQRVLAKGLAAQLTSECSVLAASGKMRVPQRRFHAKS